MAGAHPPAPTHHYLAMFFFFGQVCFSSAYKQNNSEIKERDQEEKGKWIGTEAIRKKTD